MAYVKKNVDAENPTDVAEEVEQEKSSQTASATNPADEIAALKAQIEMLTKMMSAGMMSAPVTPQPQSSLLDEVKIVHLRECISGTTTHIHFSN